MYKIFNTFTSYRIINDQFTVAKRQNTHTQTISHQKRERSSFTSNEI